MPSFSTMKFKLSILIVTLGSFLTYGQEDTLPKSIVWQRLNEMRYDLINGTIKNAGRIAVSPLKFGWKDWGYTGLVAGGVALAFTQDTYIQENVNGNPSGNAHWLATYVGEPFGNPYVATGLSLGTYIVGKSLNYDQVSDPALVAFQSVIITNTTTFMLKMLFHRQRPREGLEPDPNVWYGPSLEDNHLSFPSGHTATAFALASSLSTYYSDKKWVGLVLYPLAAITGWSRIYDNEHWFSDVAVGAAIGYFIGRTVAKPELYRWSVAPNPSGGMNIGFSYSF